MPPAQVITFYSYKGGVGRSFALANVAYLLATWGRRVLCIDWDLEAPGLQLYFEADLPSAPMALRGHEGPIYALGFAPDGRLVTAGDDRTARVWDLSSPQSEPLVLPGHEGPIYALGFAPDGRLVTAGRDGTVRVWNLSSPQTEPVVLLVLRGHEGWIHALGFAPDGRLVTGGVDGTVRVSDLSSPQSEPVVLPGHEGWINALGFAPDGRLVTAGEDSMVRIWNLSQPRTKPVVVLRGHEGQIGALGFAPDGRLVTAGEDGTVRVWDLKNPGAEPLVLRGHEGRIVALVFVPDGHLVTASDDKTARVWDLKNSAAEPLVLRGHEGPIYALGFAPDGRLASAGPDGTVRVWDLKNPAAEPLVLRGHGGWVHALDFAPDGRLVTAGEDGTVRVWDLTPRSEPTTRVFPLRDGAQAKATPGAIGETPGIVDLISGIGDSSPLSWQDCVTVWDLPRTDGRLHLISAGSKSDYISKLQDLDWDALYRDQDLGQYLETLRDEWLAEYDMVLIDSRTGITDIGAICTAQLPDVLVIVFAANEQGLAGVADVARRAEEARHRLPFERSRLHVVPVLSRFDAREEYDLAERWKQQVQARLGSFFRTWLHEKVDVGRALDLCCIPYVSKWSFGETLPSAIESRRSPEYVTYALENIASLLSLRFENTDQFGVSPDSYVEMAKRVGRSQARALSTESPRGSRFLHDIFISHEASTRDYAGALSDRLQESGWRLFQDPALVPGSEWSSFLSRAISDARHFVLLVSNSLRKEQEVEAQEFLKQMVEERSESRRIIVVRLGPADPGAHLPQLRNYQWIDAYTQHNDAGWLADVLTSFLRPDQPRREPSGSKRDWSGLKVAVLVERLYIPEEIRLYQQRFGELGITVDLMSRLWGRPKYTFAGMTDEAGNPSLSLRVALDVREVHLDDYAAVIASGGLSALFLRHFYDIGIISPAMVTEAPAVRFFAQAMRNPKIVKAASGMGLFLLTPVPELLRGRKVTCDPIALADVVNAGGIYTPSPDNVVVDGDLVTAASIDEEDVRRMIDAVMQRIDARAHLA
ncbi:MAG: TIR domain-containing protein [Isosphaeraceae bacterium]